jgi:hypothetical protein
MSGLLVATVVFLAAVLFGHGGYEDGSVTAGAFVVTLVGFVVLTLGGWLGGAVVFVHGMRVLGLVQLPWPRADTPGAPPYDTSA